MALVWSNSKPKYVVSSSLEVRLTIFLFRISEASATFGISLDQVNWLGNVISLMYIAVAPVIPIACSRYGLRFCVRSSLLPEICLVLMVVFPQYVTGACFMTIAAWVRFAGTAASLDSQGAYALLILGQVRTIANIVVPALNIPCLLQLFGAVAQATFQVLAPKYSETWFDLKGRTTATMLMSICMFINVLLLLQISYLRSSKSHWWRAGSAHLPPRQWDTPLHPGSRYHIHCSGPQRRVHRFRTSYTSL